MSDQTFNIEIQPDLLEKLTRATPVQAIAEMIWNSVDADAKRVDVKIIPGELDTISNIIISDDGVGIDYRDAPELFRDWGVRGKSSEKFLMVSVGIHIAVVEVASSDATYDSVSVT